MPPLRLQGERSGKMDEYGDAKTRESICFWQKSLQTGFGGNSPTI
jgi:hypothetical protein